MLILVGPDSVIENEIVGNSPHDQSIKRREEILDSGIMSGNVLLQEPTYIAALSIYEAVATCSNGVRLLHAFSLLRDVFLAKLFSVESAGLEDPDLQVSGKTLSTRAKCPFSRYDR